MKCPTCTQEFEIEDLKAKLTKAIEQRDRMVYDRLTVEERKLFFADKICEHLNKELGEI